MTLVRNALGEPLPCCWDDCMRPGQDEEQERVPNHDLKVNDIFVFCSTRHREMWRNSHRSYGNASSGSRGLIL